MAANISNSNNNKSDSDGDSINVEEEEMIKPDMVLGLVNVIVWKRRQKTCTRYSSIL
jgi:hypothetical protein